MAFSGKASRSMILMSLYATGLVSSTTNKCVMNYAKYFSSVSISDKDSVDATFAKVLKNEIKSLKSILKTSQAKTTPTYNFPFEIENDDCSTFVRAFSDGEFVRVQIRRSLINSKCEGDKVRDESKNDVKTPPAISMYVSVWRPGVEDNYLDLEITTSEEDIIVNRYSFIEKGYGPKIQELDYQLQRSLSSYLEKRGIKSIASFLIHNKCATEEAKNIRFLSLMKQLKKLIRK